MNDPTMPQLDDETIRTMRIAFMGKHGRQVLAWMLLDTGFFDTIHTPEAMAVRNYMVHLLEQLGILQPWNIEDITDAMIAAKLKRQRKRKNGKRKLRNTSLFRARRFIDGILGLPWKKSKT